MIVIEPFIWRTDYFVYHLTQKENMTVIKIKGLLPQNGERCKKVNDEKKAVYFFDHLDNLYEWIDALYPEWKTELYLLRFSLKRRKWYIQDNIAGEYYLKTGVNPKQIEYLRVKDIDDYLNTYQLDTPNMVEEKVKKLRWTGLEKYQEESEI